MKRISIAVIILFLIFSFLGCNKSDSTGKCCSVLQKDELYSAIPKADIPEHVIYKNIEEVKNDLTEAVEKAEQLCEYYYDPTEYAALQDLCEIARKALDTASKPELAEIANDLIESLGSLSLAKGDIPRVYLSYNEVSLNKSRYIPLRVMFSDGKNGDIDPLFVDDAEIIIRGNSTSGSPKKPYNIKLSKSKKVLGLPSGKKWCLLAESFDKTMMRNYIAFSLGHKFGLSDTPNFRYVDVYVNGIFKGMYLLCTPISDGRLNLDKKENSYLFETEATRPEPGKDFYTTPIFGLRFMIKHPDSLDNEKREYLNCFFGNMEGALKSRDMSVLKEYIDIESFVNSFVLHEIMKPIDFTYSSVYYTLCDGVLKAGPIWDFDLSSGNASTNIKYDTYKRYNNLSGSGGDESRDSAHGFWVVGHWYDALREIPDFMRLVKERFIELQPQIVNLYSENELGPSLISEIYSAYGSSFFANYEEGGWSVGTPYSYYERNYPDATYDENLKYLQAWFKRRNQWLLAQWDN